MLGIIPTNCFKVFVPDCTSLLGPLLVRSLEYLTAILMSLGWIPRFHRGNPVQASSIPENTNAVCYNCTNLNYYYTSAERNQMKVLHFGTVNTKALKIRMK